MMLQFLPIIAFLSFARPKPDFTGLYYHHIQICSVFKVIDKSWKLDIKKDSSFVYTIRVFTSQNQKDSIYKASGSWEISNDTMTLKTYQSPYLYQFVIKPDTLCPIGEKEQLRDGFFTKLNYLTKYGGY